VTAKALTYVPRARSRNDGSEEICQSIRAADSDAGSDKPERDADAEAELPHDRFATLIANCAAASTLGVMPNSNRKRTENSDGEAS
jgi:hypothetical protein